MSRHEIHTVPQLTWALPWALASKVSLLSHLSTVMLIQHWSHHHYWLCHTPLYAMQTVSSCSVVY